MTKTTEYTITFTGGGSVVLELGDRYAHSYDDMAQAAADVAAYISDPDTSGWEGHDPELLGYADQVSEQYSSGYCIYTDVADILADTCGWGNIERFATAWRQLQPAR